jgi:predicted nucleotidyltransferase
MSVKHIIKKKRNQVLEIANSHGVRSIKLFGSVARGEDNSASDIDFLVAFDESRTLFDLIRLKADLEVLFEKPVHVISEDGINHFIRDRISSEAISI